MAPNTRKFNLLKCRLLCSGSRCSSSWGKYWWDLMHAIFEVLYGRIATGFSNSEACLTDVSIACRAVEQSRLDWGAATWWVGVLIGTAEGKHQGDQPNKLAGTVYMVNLALSKACVLLCFHEINSMCRRGWHCQDQRIFAGINIWYLWIQDHLWC